MSGTIIAIIILAAIFGGYLIDYQKNKLKWQSKNAESSKDFDELKGEMDRMKRRIENLEAIVTEDSPVTNEDDPFRDSSEYSNQIKMENELKAAQKVKNRGD